MSWRASKAARAKDERRKKLREMLSNWPTEQKCWVYLLLSEYGDLYVGQTNHLRWRLRDHHRANNRCATQGQRWRYLAAIPVRSRGEALELEAQFHASAAEVGQWVDRSECRMKVLMRRYGFPRPTVFQRVHLSWRRAYNRIPPYLLDGF